MTRATVGLNQRRAAEPNASAKASAVGSDTSTPVTPSRTVSSAPPRAERDDRTSAGLGLDRDDAEVLLAGQHDRRGAAIQVPDLVVGLVAQELDGASGRVRPQPIPFRPLADDAERQACETGGVDRQVDSLVGHQGRHYQQVAFRDPSIRLEELGVHGRVHDVRLAIIVSADSARNIM